MLTNIALVCHYRRPIKSDELDRSALLADVARDRSIAALNRLRNLEKEVGVTISDYYKETDKQLMFIHNKLQQTEELVTTNLLNIITELLEENAQLRKMVLIYLVPIGIKQ